MAKKKKTLAPIKGIKVRKARAPALKLRADLASALQQLLPDTAGSSRDRAALLSTMQALNLLATSTAQCTLAGPPADIDMTLDDKGDLIYRCQHENRHSWDLQGRRL